MKSLRLAAERFQDIGQTLPEAGRRLATEGNSVDGRPAGH